jgi:hypothetical protein
MEDDIPDDIQRRIPTGWYIKPKKNIEDLTLKEAQEICGKAVSCQVCELHVAKTSNCICHSIPNNWRFDGNPIFTQEEKQYAKVLKKVFDYDLVTRDNSGKLYLEKEGKSVIPYELNSGVFKSIKSGFAYTLDAIINQ